MSRKHEIGDMVLEQIGKADFDAVSEFYRACAERMRELKICANIRLKDAEIALEAANEELSFCRNEVFSMSRDMATDGVTPEPDEDPQIEADIASQPAPVKRPALAPAAHNVLAKAGSRKPGKESNVIPISAARKARKK